MGHRHEKRPAPVPLLQKLKGEIRDAVRAVAPEVHPVHVLVKHVAPLPVGGELQHVRGPPEAAVAAPVGGGDGRHRVVHYLAGPVVAGQVPFADVGGLIARPLQGAGQGRGIQGQRDAVAVAARGGGILPGLEDRPAGPAHRLGGEGLLKQQPLCRQGVQAGGHLQRLAIGAAGVRPLLV